MKVVVGTFSQNKIKKCVAYPQEDFLFMKLITRLE
jgi:hypothetical protein